MNIFTNPITMVIGKGVFVIIAMTVCIFSLYVAVMFMKWHAQLKLLESTADVMRENAIFNFTLFRAQLGRFSNKLNQPPLQFNSSNLQQTAILLARFFLMKERSIFQWGSFGLKMAKYAYSFLKKR